ncbi:DUF952 domain-containing protein [Virgisporangium aurantiacum]|uniref:DUF952 domain-containing protein n=1 Tax=Virgisporangium aurantiacum TaxID=175570 RepID=A0A8J4E1E2_9ACTN|nr:DUF952 domain-containing protein [Virgisporangium aurantiacum]GIJ55917.1 hypothetical protein Vau01_034330 [Virgisporangium aurantiacum]
MTELFHLTEAATWEAARAAGEYRQSTRGVTLEQQGFIHCSLRHQVRPVAETFYADADDLVLLTVDLDKLTAPVRFESDFPHIYGPIPVDAVVNVVPVTRDDTGRMVLPG